MAGNRINTEGIMLFEQPFARVPYENYRKVFRTSQKHIEKDFGAIQVASKELSKRTIDPETDEETLKALDGMINRVTNLKRKLSDLHQSSGAPTLAVMHERLQHLATAENLQNDSGHEYAQWADTRLERWLVDWALRNGKEKTAKQLAEERGLEKLVDIDLFSDIRRIEDALRRQSCAEALAWCSENKAALRKLKNPLEFDLRLQEFIELARARKLTDAIAYQKKYLIQWHETHAAQIRQASALIAFMPHTSCGPYKRLYDPGRWLSLVHAFRLAIYNLSTLPTEPLLHLAIYGGLASLKLPSCYDHETKNMDCPVCDPNLGRLAEEVPFSHHLNSTIVCSLTGKIMNEDNWPMAFPGEGNVYSKEALEDMATRNNGFVTCPRTGERCHFSALRKVFIS
ncbi:hypothetical protein QCA50_015455 [Cerrena zonata]|uniref:Macrophage erythroblast attacher n=1 Tax=Cerrena zonata TaxID=2478898 RepID=A0AAW0FQN9_9APHY